MQLIPPFIHRRIAHRPNLVRIVDNVAWLFVDKILRMGVGLLVGVWVARYLGPEQFGQFNFAQALVGMFGAIAGMGLQGIVVRDLVRDPSGKEETLGTAALLLALGGLIAYALVLGTIFWLRPEDRLAKILVAILGTAFLLKAGDVAIYCFEARVQSRYTVWVQNGMFLFFAAVKVALILTNANLLAFAWTTAAEALAGSILMLLVLDSLGPRLRQLRVTFSRAKQLLRDAWPLLLSGISIMIYMRIDQIMLGQMLGDEAVGLYSAAVRISEVWYFIPMAIVASVSPSIIEAKKLGESVYLQRLQSLFDIMMLISVSVAAAMTFISNSVMELLFGESFSKAGLVLAIHIWTSPFVFLGVASGPWFINEGLQVINFYRTIAGAVINVMFNFLLIPRYGIYGASFATVIAQFSVGLVMDGTKKSTRDLFFMKIESLLFKNFLKKIL